MRRALAVAAMILPIACSTLIGLPDSHLAPADTGVEADAMDAAVEAPAQVDAMDAAVEAPAQADAMDAAVEADSATPDAYGDAADATDAEGDVDAAADASACVSSGNLLVNGDFAAGSASWSLEKCKVEPIAGPCGDKGLRVYEITSYGGLTQYVGRSLAKGTRLRLRGWLKSSGVGAVRAPWLSIDGVFWNADAGTEERVSLASALMTREATWRPTELTFALDRDLTGLVVRVASSEPDPDEFALASVSVTVE